MDAYTQVEVPDPNGRAATICPARLLDQLPGLVAYFDRDLRYVYANATYSRWRGFDPAAMIGRYVREIVGERNYPGIAEKLRQALAGDQAVYEYHLFDGQDQRRVRATYTPDLGEAGDVVGVIALVTEVSTRDQLQLQIARSEAMFIEAFENGPAGLAIVDVQGGLVRVNTVFATMLGRSREELVGMNFAQITHPDDLLLDQELFQSVLRRERGGYRIEKRYIRPDGMHIFVRLGVSAIRNDRGEVEHFFANVEDVTQQREAARRLQETNARLSLVTEAIRGGSWHMDVASGRFETSLALARFILGPDAEPQDLDGYRSRIHPEDIGASDLTPLLSGQQDRSSAEYRLRTYDGTRWMRCDRRLLRDAKGQPEQIVGVTIDLTEEHERRARAEVQARTDHLTGLLNRRGLEQRLRTLPRDTPCGVLAIDLDRFKQVNDHLGHNAGDAVLVETATRLLAMVRGSDLVARVGGDEFVVVLVGTDVAGLKSMAARATGLLQEGFAACEDRDMRVGASIGATWSSSSSLLDGVLARADAALYQAKAAGRGTWRLAA